MLISKTKLFHLERNNALIKNVNSKFKNKERTAFCSVLAHSFIATAIAHCLTLSTINASIFPP